MYCRNCGAKLTEDSKFCHECGVQTDNIEAKKKKNKVKDTELSNGIYELFNLIEQRRQNAFQIGIDEEITKKLKEKIDSKEAGERLIKNYNDILKLHLIDDLKSLSNNYDNIKAYLSTFIEFDIIESVFPHKLKKPQTINPGDKKTLKLELSTPTKNDLKNQKRNKFNGCLIIIGVIFIIGLIGSIFSPIDESVQPVEETTQTDTNDKWYQGGNLHKAKVSEWREATDKNKLATCADFMAATNRDISMGDLLAKSVELKTCIDTAIVGVDIINNSPIAEIAALCMVTLGYK